MESGARWIIHGGTGSSAESGAEGSAGISILMGGDLPDYRLTGFGVGRTIGDAPGFTVGLDLDSVDRQWRVSFWKMEDVGRRVGVFLTNPTKPGLGQNSPDAEDRDLSIRRAIRSKATPQTTDTSQPQVSLWGRGTTKHVLGPVALGKPERVMPIVGRWRPEDESQSCPHWV